MGDIVEALAQGTAPEEAVERALLLSGEEQEELLRAVASLRSERASRFLFLFYGRLSDRKLQKLAKKALFRLKTLGVPVEEPRSPGESVLKKVESSREARAFLSNYDGELTRVVLAAFEAKRHQFLFSHALLHFSRGLVELRSFPVARADLEELLRDYAAGTRRPIVLQPISPPYAGYLIEEASAISGKESEEAGGLRRFLSSVKDGPRRPEEVYLLETEGAALPEEAETLFARDLFEPFLLQWPDMVEDRKGLDQAVNPALVLPPYVVEERRQAFLEDLAEKERLASMLPFFTRMLEDYAYLFHVLGEPGAHRGLIVLLKDRAALEKAFLHFVRNALEGMEQKAPREPGLIIDPRSLVRK
jgi:hypothetical protein